MRYCLNDRTAGNWTTLEGVPLRKFVLRVRPKKQKKGFTAGTWRGPVRRYCHRVGSIKRARPRVHLHHTGCIRGFECAAPRAFILDAAANTHSVAVSSYTGTVDSTDEQSPEERIAMWHYEDEEADCTGSTDEHVAVSRPSQSPEDRIAMWHYEDEESDGSTDEQVFHDFEDFERCMDYMDYS